MISAIQRLMHQLEDLPLKVKAIPEEKISFKPSADKWSKKEILGHLIDSASNNHTRFMKALIESDKLIIAPYEQNKWVELNMYQERPISDLINLWFSYNKHILNLILSIPDNKLDHPCDLGGAKTVSLSWLINDYVDHLQHHINQIAIDS